ncbi:XapX domain-containing protein [Maledivibacter halophilus]|uniref:XapX domain-containing protein n=1 Tax=Maledivibacter halophilus TaxID=36842 RepID=A0A1T5K080_9FIRM|nr:XapX domain-containing protein [Maledivibacter halophilus]SKC56905.1 XapX domain-containing protein [Maledivibacter halophilus]
MNILLEIIKPAIAGIVLGILFKKARLPLPAPPVLAGVIGILGVLIGGKLIEFFV